MKLLHLPECRLCLSEAINAGQMARNMDVEFYVLEIRRLAAKCQQGEPFVSARSEVNDLICSYKKVISKNPDYEILAWSVLIDHLEPYLLITAAPGWVEIVHYARHLAKRRRQQAISYSKRIPE